MNDEVRYRGRTPGEAMKKARTALGENARLVDARRVSGRGQFPMYEVRVLPPTDDAARSSRDLRPETHEEGDPAAERWLEVLRQRGASESVAREIVETAERDAAGRQGLFQTLRQTIAERFGDAALTIPPGERSTVLVGPTGAGKTTVLSRIASEGVKRGEHPILVSTDGESIAGEDALRIVADALDVRFETAFLDGQMPALLERHGGDEIWFVDTPGRAPFDDDGLAGVKRLVRSLPDPEVLLVMPASTDADEARLLLDGYGRVGIDRVVLTKLDELCRPARILDLARTIDRPIAWVTYGRSIRGTSSAPGDARVVSRILGTSLAVPAAV
jgi:flagellar biosynthesis GTPase FlhF